MSMDLSQDTRERIHEMVEADAEYLPEQLGIDHIVCGCPVVNLDPYAVGVGVYPRYIQCALRGEYYHDVWYRGGVSGLAVGTVLDVIHLSEGNRYEVLGPGGATGSSLWIHDHSSDTEGGQNLHAIEEFEFEDTTELTINAGAVTRTQVYHRIDTQGGAATDDLDTINGGAIGDVIVLRPEDGARTVVVKHNTGNIWLLGNADVDLDDINDHIMLIYDGTKWCSIDEDGAGGGGVAAGEWLALAAGVMDFEPDNPATVTTAGVVTEYATIALAIAGAAATDCVVIPPGTYNESITLKAGVYVIELFPGSVIINSTAANTAVTTVNGGYIKVKEIRCTRANNNIAAVTSSHAAGSCIVIAELIRGENAGTGDVYGVYHTGAGTLYVYADDIQASGGDDECIGLNSTAGIVYAWANELLGENGTGAYTLGADCSVSTQYIWADCRATDDTWVCGADVYNTGTQIIHGDCYGISAAGGADAYGIYCDDDNTVQTVYGNVYADGVDISYGAYTRDSCFQTVYGNCTAAAATASIGAFCTTIIGTPTQYVEGDCVGAIYGAECTAGTQTIMYGRVYGGTTDLYRTGGTLNICSVQATTTSGTITTLNQPGLDVTRQDASTNVILYHSRFGHITSGAAAALFGVGEVHTLEDSAGNEQDASEVATLWAVSTSGNESPLRRWTTYPTGSAGPGYQGFWTYDAVDGTARTVIPNGTGDVTGILTVNYAVLESAAGTAGGNATVVPGANVNLYSDGVDTLQLQCAADGSVTVQRTAGAATFKIALTMTWV